MPVSDAKKNLLPPNFYAYSDTGEGLEQTMSREMKIWNNEIYTYVMGINWY